MTVERIQAPQEIAGGAPALMRSHTVTIYNAIGEIDRHAAYRRTVLHGVRVEEISGAVATMQGRSSTDGVLLFIPGNIAGYVDPHAYHGAGWTLRDGDLIAIGTCEHDVPPATVQQLEAERRCYRITGAEPLTGRKGRVRHWEVAGA